MSRKSIRAFEAYLRAQGKPVPKPVDVGARCWRPKPEPANDVPKREPERADSPGGVLAPAPAKPFTSTMTKRNQIASLRRRMRECLAAGDFDGLALLQAQLYVLLRDG